jgi:hypothetical protein
MTLKFVILNSKTIFLKRKFGEGVKYAFNKKPT